MPVDCSRMEMSSGFTLNSSFEYVGQLPSTRPRPASNSSRLVTGAFQVAWYRPAGWSRKLKNDSGAPTFPLATFAWQWQSRWGSTKKLNLLRSDARHVTRVALD